MEAQPTGPARLIPAKQVHEQYFPWSEMTTWRKLRERSIPQPIILNRKRYWRVDELEAWLAERTAERDGADPQEAA